MIGLHKCGLKMLLSGFSGVSAIEIIDLTLFSSDPSVLPACFRHHKRVCHGGF